MSALAWFYRWWHGREQRQRDRDRTIDLRELTTAHPTRLAEIEQRQLADAEAKVLRVSGKGQRGAQIPAVMERKS